MPTSRSRAWRAVPAVLAVLAAAIAPATAAAKASPGMFGTASSNTTVGYTVFDHTNLSGGASPTGTITFRLYAPGDTSCSAPVFTTSVPVSGTGSDDSSRYTTARAGTYQWTATYNGDANNNPVATACGYAPQTVIVAQAGPVASASVTVSAGTIHGIATLQGGFAPLTGTVTFTVTGPNDVFCGGTVVWSSTVAVNGAGSYDSGGFTPTAPGTYKYRLRYNGDTNNLGVGPTACLDQNASITLAQAQLAPPGTGGGGPATGGTVPVGSATSPTGTTAAAGPGATTAHPATSTAAAGTTFTGPARCVRGRFTVSVAGAGVRRVTYLVHGRVVRTVTRADSRGRFRATVNPRGLRRGVRMRLTAKVASGSGAAVLHRTFSVCR
jgi:hypothetical protein